MCEQSIINNIPTSIDLVDLLCDDHALLQPLTHLQDLNQPFTLTPTPIHTQLTHDHSHIITTLNQKHNLNLHPTIMPTLIAQYTLTHTLPTTLKLAFYTAPNANLHHHLHTHAQLPPFLTQGLKGPFTNRPQPKPHIPASAVLIPANTTHLAHANDILFLTYQIPQ